MPVKTNSTEDRMRHEMFHTTGSRGSSEPIEIRVTADAIIEVYGKCPCLQMPASGRGARGKHANITARAMFAFALFGAVAALLMWVLLK
ncbi:MAG: hypothetical protein WAM91_15275 [Candidatus Acidiferrales bacterium]